MSDNQKEVVLGIHQYCVRQSQRYVNQMHFTKKDLEVLFLAFITVDDLMYHSISQERNLKENYSSWP